MEKYIKDPIKVENPQNVKAISVHNWEITGCPSCGSKLAECRSRTKTTDLMICLGPKCQNRHYVVIDDDFGRHKRSTIGFVEAHGTCENHPIYPEIS